MAVSAPRARDDGLPPRFDGGRPPHEHGCNSYPPFPYCDKQNHPTNKCWKQFCKPPTATTIVTPSATLSLALLVTPTPHYHVTLMSVEYDVLHHSRSINAASLANLASLLTPSTLGTSAHLASSSPPWIINSRASSHMTKTSSLLSSYHLSPSHPAITIYDGCPCPVQGHDTTRVTNSLSLHQILYVPGFPVNLLFISVSTRALPYTVTFFPFHCIFQDLHTRQRIGLSRENGWGIYELVSDEPSLGLRALFVISLISSSLLWHRRLGHPCFERLKKTLQWLSLTQFLYESCQMGKHHWSFYSSRDGILSSAPFDLLHSDVWGPW